VRGVMRRVGQNHVYGVYTIFLGYRNAGEGGYV